MRKALLSISIVVAAQSVFAATVPAGATLVVRTLQTISTDDRAGKTVSAELDQAVSANGSVVLPKGAKVTCRIESSPKLSGRQSRPLTVNITEIAIDGRMVPIKTSNAFELKSAGGKTRRSGVPITSSSFTVPSGTKMQFQLAQALTL